ncbi:DUF7519 family protein [Halorientalis halophila]|uniref:DUF7519 family protein n=1 Tax=Halorientalis halophila TaxID=3108499 RepID=UPI0030080495
MTEFERTDGGTADRTRPANHRHAATDRARQTVDHRPSSLGSVLAVTLAALSTALVATDPLQNRSLAVVLLGVLVLGVGYRGREGALPTVRLGLGLAVVFAGIWLSISADLGRIADAELLPGLYGLTVLGLGLLPIREGWETKLATLGVALVLVTVLFSGITRDAGLVPILAATVAAVAAWDAARHAITLGEQVGRSAVEPIAELAHLGATTGVGVATVALAVTVWRLQITDVPLLALVCLLGAGAALLFVVYE